MRIGIALFLLSLSLLFAKGGNLLDTNPGFENGETGWDFSGDDGMSRLSDEAAHTGSFGLRVTDDSQQKGSSVAAQRMAVVPGTGYRLSFWGRIVSGGGIGVYVRYYNASQTRPVFTQQIDIPSKQTGWKQYTLDSIAPADAETAEVWIHSYSPAQVVAEVDDLSLAPFASAAKPPWEPTYKLSPSDTSRLTAADVVGPDGLVYPNWRLAGVPGGIPDVATVIGADFFTGFEDLDISARLDEAINKAAAQGGGAIALPAGTFYLDHPILIRESGVVIRGAGRDKTVLTYRDLIPRGEVRFFNWSGTDEKIGPGGVMEAQANPKDLMSMRIESKGHVLKEADRKTEGKGWGNRFALRITGNDLMKKLGPGEHEIIATANYGNGDRFSKSQKIHVAEDFAIAVSPDQNGIFVLLGPGKMGSEILLSEDGKRGSLTLRLAAGHGLRAGDRIILEAPVTERWNQLVGNIAKASRFRLYYYEIVAVADDTVTLNQPLRIEFPVQDGSFVQRTGFVQRSGIEDLTIVQQPVPGDPSAKKPESLKYWYPVEDLWMDGVTSSYAWGCWVRGVRVVTAGRNPLFLTRSKFCEIRDCEADDALFKGGGGTAYVGLERSFDCLMDSVTTHKMRHAPDLQWGAAGNVIRNGRFYGSDAQWHAGWTNENLLEGNLIVSDAADMASNNGYGYGLFATGPSDPIHGPQGPRNVAYHNDVISPKDGVHMRGGNEAWIIAYNRFRISEGHAVYGKEKTFDHIIRENTFIIERAPEFAIQFDAPECTGIELIGNTFYGPIGKIAGFPNDIGEYAREDNNRILPYSADAPMPNPPVVSIFEWQRAQ